MHDLAQVLVRRPCGDPVDILLKRPLHWDLEDPLRWCLYESSSGTVIRSSCLKISWRHFLTIFWIWNFLRCPGPGMKFWCEVLMTRHNVASCARPSKLLLLSHGLLLFHTDCWLYLAHWLPTRYCLGSLGGVTFVNSLVHRFRDQHLPLCQTNRY